MKQWSRTEPTNIHTGKQHMTEMPLKASGGGEGR
jgi:hypothetical protein